MRKTGEFGVEKEKSAILVEKNVKILVGWKLRDQMTLNVDFKVSPWTVLVLRTLLE